MRARPYEGMAYARKPLVIEAVEHGPAAEGRARELVDVYKLSGRRATTVPRTISAMNVSVIVWVVVAESRP